MEYDLNELNNTNPKVKYDAQKKILELSETNPNKLYPDFDYFTNLLTNKNNIMIWTGLLVLGNLSKVDSENKIDKILPQMISKLNAGKMITAGNAMRSLINIAIAKPKMADDIALEILKSAYYKFDTEECSYIHIGHMFKCIELIWSLLSNKIKNEYIEFAKKEVINPRSATAKKAILFLKKFDKKIAM